MKFNYRNQFSELSTKTLRMLPAELSHNIGLFLLRRNIFKIIPQPPKYYKDEQFHCSVPGVGKIANPICLAAGFDKNAGHIKSLSSLNFGMVEVGTVTPKPQGGNPKPRIFRYPNQKALINRMGFNNVGSDQVRKNIDSENTTETPLGINLGINKSTDIRKASVDYTYGLDYFLGKGSYFVINVSSPNTNNLRDLASPNFINQLSQDIEPEARKKVWIKLDPDMKKESFQSLIYNIGKNEFAGIILTNTHKVSNPEPGGLSGKPIFQMSNLRLEWAWEVHQGKMPMIGVGGILTGKDVFEKIRRGACAVQIYSALIYRGPWVVDLILNELHEELKRTGYNTISQVLGSYYSK